MLRAWSLAVAFLVLPIGAPAWSMPASKRMPTCLTVFTDAKTDPGGNAALKYWQAFATLPKFTGPEFRKIDECMTTPLDDQARKMLTEAEYSLQMLYRGVGLRDCDWGMSYSEDGVFARLPHADAARVLTSLAILRARLRFEASQSTKAIDDLFAALTLGRHVSLDGSLITVLVGYSIEHRVTNILAAHLPSLDAKTIKDLKVRLDALPASGSPAVALLTCEKETIDWFIRKIKEAKDQEGLIAFLGWVGISEGKDRDSGEKARAFLKECGGTAEGVIKFAEETQPSYSVMAKMLALPLNEFQKAFEGESIRQAGNPVYKVFFPAMAKVREARARADVRRAMFSAALAVRLDGPDVLKDHLDPVVGGPFEYVPFQGGFELRSKLKGQDDKVLTLTVGHRS
jgi:hypothetical protein